MATGKELKRIRESNGYSAKKFAEMIGINQERLRKWEQLDSEPRIEDRKLIELFFGVPLHSLANIQEIPKTSQTETGAQEQSDISIVETNYKEKYIASLEARITEKEKAFDVLAEQSKAIVRLLENKVNKVDANLDALVSDMNIVLAKAAVQLQVSNFHYSKLAGISRQEAEKETDNVIAEVIGASGVKDS